MTEIYYTEKYYKNHRLRRNRRRNLRRRRRRKLLTLCILFLFLLTILAIFNIVMTPRYSVETISSEQSTDWNLMLVNKQHPIPDDYRPQLMELSNGTMIDERIYPELQAMFDAARLEGYDPEVVSGYRTAETQQQLMDEKISEYEAQGYSRSKAEKLAEEWVAPVGTSEHQTGLAVDINGSSYDIYIWLQENCWQYGFICRYPTDKTDITEISYEEWHYRYVGYDAAADIYDRGLCLEEYLDDLS